MANCCSYLMQVQGKPENVDEFIKIISCEPDYGKNEFSFDRHFWRINAVVDDEKIENEIKTALLSGDCANSVKCCTFDQPASYQNTFSNNMDRLYECNKDTVCRGTDILTESKKLDLIIEIYSEEDDCQKHLIINKGDIEVDDFVEYNFIRWDKDEYPTIEELSEGYGETYTEDQFDEDGDCIIGGFSEWTFTDNSGKFVI